MAVFFAHTKHEVEGRRENTCLFCRQPASKNDDEAKINMMKRIEANDSFAMCHMGIERHEEGDYKSAFEYCTKAAQLGAVKAHHELALLYDLGRGVE
mmetsp:Transcript_27172/g.40871  ORF Transcript_27172/g.40871 Transcript_27172/m.40871 type:complete len:97 (-) Transcript_27172:377-667(-)